MSLAANHKDEAERKLKELAEEQQLEKNIKDKISILHNILRKCFQKH